MLLEQIILFDRKMSIHIAMWFSKEIKSLPQTPIFYSLPTSMPPDVVLNFDITNLDYLI